MKKNQIIILTTFYFFMATITNLAGQDSISRGIYFSKKEYKATPLPDFNKIKKDIPIPQISDKYLIDMYWFCWELAFNKLKVPLPKSPFVSNYIDEAFCPNIFQWDTHFMIMFWKYVHTIFPAIESQDNFYRCQHADGYICREIKEADGTDFYYGGKDNTINPPLYPWVEWDYYTISEDDSRFKMVLPVLEKYADWLNENRVKKGTKHGLYWQTSLGSGMDNSPRSGSGWTDMSAQMTMFYKYLSMMAVHVGMADKGKIYKVKADEIAKKINQYMWNEQDGLYYDLDDNGLQIKSKTVASFWTMLAGIANKHQAELMLKNLQDPKEFWRTIPFPTLSADDTVYHPRGQYWQGGVWAPTNYMIIKGLEDYGYYDFANKASLKYLEGMGEVFKKTHTVWENYSPDSLMEGNLAAKNFVGWTGLGPIALLIESVIGIKSDGLNNTINWHITRTDLHGVENLKIKDNSITLLCKERKAVTDKAFITITATKPFTLIIHKNNSTNTFQIKSGNNTIEI